MPDIETLKIDDKWSIRYDPDNNDRPTYLMRHGELHTDFRYASNHEVAMFYALLEKQRIETTLLDFGDAKITLSFENDAAPGEQYHARILHGENRYGGIDSAPIMALLAAVVEWEHGSRPKENPNDL